MYWTATIEKGSPAAGKASSVDLRQRPLAPSCEGSANALSAEPRLRADRARRFGGRAGLQPCHINAARNAFQPALRYSEGCAAFLAACIRSARGALVPALRHKRLAPNKSEGSQQVFAFRRPIAASPHWPKPPSSRLRHPVSARNSCRVELPLTCAESATSIFLFDTLLRGRFRPSNPPAAPTHRIHFYLKSIFRKDYGERSGAFHTLYAE